MRAPVLPWSATGSGKNRSVGQGAGIPYDDCDPWQPAELVRVGPRDIVRSSLKATEELAQGFPGSSWIELGPSRWH